jgi:hypothetical protein
MSKSYRKDPDFQDNSKKKDRRQLRQTAARNKRSELDRAADRPQPVDYNEVYSFDF